MQSVEHTARIVATAGGQPKVANDGRCFALRQALPNKETHANRFDNQAQAGVTLIGRREENLRVW